MRRLDDILNDVDAEIAAAGHTKEASAKPELADEDIFKLAEQLKTEPAAEPVEEPVNLTITEKLAHSVALCETMMNMPLLLEMRAFEKVAVEKGASPEQIEDYLEKKASGKYRALKILGLGTLGAGAAAGSGVLGHAKGKEQGRNETIDAINRYYGAQT